jgi:hypothetical protein
MLSGGPGGDERAEQAVLLVGGPGDEEERSLEARNSPGRIVAAGFRSFLSSHTAAREQEMTLAFSSERANAFSRDDLPVARLVADDIALAVSDEQLAEAERRVAEARIREERLEARVKSLVAELGSRPDLRSSSRSAPR